MDGPKAQDRIYKGYGIAADHIGLPYTIYRSPDGIDPIEPANIVGEINMTHTNSWTYMNVKKYGDNAWIILADGRELYVGDYLVSPQRTFFIASMEHLQPILGVMCDRIITISRPKAPDGVGDVGYSGYEDITPATHPVLYQNVPASFLKSSRGEKNRVALPTDAKMPWYAAYLPYWEAAFLRNGDIITDTNKQQYIVSDNEHTSMGWHLNVHGLEA
jgi:hypothetical protein